MENFYELHSHIDPGLPIIFHNDCIFASRNIVTPHWHENIEILFFHQGSAEVICDGVTIYASEGGIVPINSCTVHSVHALTYSCSYYVLIVDKDFCNEQDFNIAQISIQEQVSDTKSFDYLDHIVVELNEKKIYYKSAVKAAVLVLLTRLYRLAYTTSSYTLASNNPRLEVVKAAIIYIHSNYKNPLTVDEICKNIGFSKYYFCRTFRELTGRTVIEFINILRCENARHLLATGRYNVSESAEHSGFTNLSHFTKVYKKYMGVLPSEEIRNDLAPTNHGLSAREIIYSIDK